MKLFSIVFAFLLSVSGLITAQAQALNEPTASPEFNCYQETKLRLRFELCYNEKEFTNSPDIVYFFHGVNDDEKSVSDSLKGLAQVQKIWKRANYQPRIVSVSFGRRNILVRNIATAEHLFFLKDVIPYVEKQFDFPAVGQRHIVGYSIGAESAINLTLRKEVQFNSVSLLCPTISYLNPYRTQKTFDDFVTTNRLSAAAVEGARSLQKENYLSPLDWNNNEATLLLSKFGSKNRPKIFVSASKRDAAGYYLGTEKFVQQAMKLGFKPLVRPTMAGSLCRFNADALAKFIMN